MHVEQCRVCDRRELVPFLNLGPTALANRFVRPGIDLAAEPMFPLRVVLCPHCGLVQIDEQVPPEVLFKDYVYVTGTSDLARAHAGYLAQRYVNQFDLKPKNLVLEAASNDGTVLKAFAQYGVRTLGIEPAENIAARANADGIETLAEFWNAPTAWGVRERYGPAKLILARHVLAHVADLHGFVRGLEIMLDRDGLAAVEMPHLLPFYDQLEYDTVYHEHLCYFSVRVLKTLFERFGLELLDVQEVAIHGGSILVTAQRRGGPRSPAANVGRMIEREERAGLHQLAPWHDFARRVSQSRDLLLSTLDGLRAAGRRLAGYGAPAKGMTLLSYCGIGPDRLPYVVDKNPLKQGLLSPGQHIPVYPPEKLLQDQPDVTLLLAWNFAAEVVEQQAEYGRRGGKWLLPLPAAHYWQQPRAFPRQAA
jgi:novobiocin biosynthesis protein NovU/D-mycarose 3-C-methyltransferase